MILAWVWAAAGFAVLYALQLPAPKYNPVEGEWGMQFPEDVPAMSWYGRILWGTAGAIVAGFGRFAAVRMRESACRLWIESAIAGIAILGSAAWLVVEEWRYWIAPS